MWHYPLPLFDNVWFDGHLTRTQGQPCLHILFTPHVLFPSLLYSLRVTHSMLLTKRYSLNVLFLIKNINPKMFLTCWIKQNLSVRNLVLDKIFLFTCYLNLFKFRERERERSVEHNNNNNKKGIEIDAPAAFLIIFCCLILLDVIEKVLVALRKRQGFYLKIKKKTFLNFS